MTRQPEVTRQGLSARTVWLVADVDLRDVIVGEVEAFDNREAAQTRAERLGVACWPVEVQS